MTGRFTLKFLGGSSFVPISIVNPIVIQESLKFLFRDFALRFIHPIVENRERK
jgi:hypothetical protein